MQPRSKDDWEGCNNFTLEQVSVHKFVRCAISRLTCHIKTTQTHMLCKAVGQTMVGSVMTSRINYYIARILNFVYSTDLSNLYNLSKHTAKKVNTTLNLDFLHSNSSLCEI